jgi:hypothetical protein
VFALTIGCIGLFNYFIDPNCIWGKSYRNNRIFGYQYRGNIRYNEYFRLALGDCKAETVILGGSRSYAFVGLSNNIEPVFLWGSQIGDYIRYLQYIYVYDKSLKNVYIQIDIDMFTDFKRSMIRTGQFINFSPDFPDIFSFYIKNLFGVRSDSFTFLKVTQSIGDRKPHNSFRDYFNSEKAVIKAEASYTACDFQSTSVNYQQIKSLVALCNQYKLNYVFFFCPDSYVRLDVMSKESIAAVKKSLVELTPFVDLFYYSSFTRNLLNYTDANHFTKEAAVQVLKAIVEKNCDISLWLTTENINNCLTFEKGFSEISFKRIYYP